MEIKLTYSNSDHVRMAQLMSRIAQDDYSRDDCDELIAIGQKAKQVLVDLDIMRSNSCFTLSSIKAAFTSDVEPILLPGEEF